MISKNIQKIFISTNSIETIKHLRNEEIRTDHSIDAVDRKIEDSFQDH